MALKKTQAKCTLNGKVMSLNELNTYPNGDEVLENLRCLYCSCPLTFNHSGKRSACLSTKIDGVHSENCPFKVDREVSKRRTLYTNIGTGYLTPNKQEERARRATYEYKKQMALEAGQEPSKKNHNKKDKPNYVKGDDTVSEVKESLKPTLNKNNPSISDDTNDARIMTKHLTPVTLDSRALNSVCVITGELDKITFLKNGNVTIVLKCHKSKCNIFLNDAFFKAASEGYIEALRTFSKMKVPERLVFSATVNVVPSSFDNGFLCMPTVEETVLFDSRSLRKYIYQNRNLLE